MNRSEKNNTCHDSIAESNTAHELSRRNFMQLLAAGAITEVFTHEPYTADAIPELDKLDALEIVLLVEGAFRHKTRNGLYVETLDNPKEVASLWAHGQMLKMLDRGVSAGYVSQTKLESAESALTKYFSDSPADYPKGYNSEVANSRLIYFRYIDDNLWIAEHFLGQYTKTNDPSYLDKSNDIAQIFIRSWNDTGGDGAYWKAQMHGLENNRSRVVVSNAPAIPLLIELAHNGYGQDDYIQYAENTYEWLQKLRDTNTGMYFDSFNDSDEIVKYFFPYCQAKIIDSIVALHGVKPNKYQLDDAMQLFDKSVDYFTKKKRLADDRAFDTMLVESGMRLATLLNDPEFTDRVEQFALAADNASRKHTPPEKLINAASAGNLAMLARMSPDEWNNLWYTTKPHEL